MQRFWFACAVKQSLNCTYTHFILKWKVEGAVGSFQNVVTVAHILVDSGIWVVVHYNIIACLGFRHSN
jgi:hypothetical protein